MSKKTENESVEAENAFDEDTSPDIRRAFIRKVNLIRFAQLVFITGVVALFVYEPCCNLFVTTYWWVSVIFLIGACAVSFALACSEHVRRAFPCNIILFCIYTLLAAIGFGALAANFAFILFLFAPAIMAAVSFLVILLTLQKCIEIVGWRIYLCIASMVLSLFGLIAVIFFFVLCWTEIMHIVYLVLAAVVAMAFSIYFMYLTQAIVRGKKFPLTPKEYVLGIIVLTMGTCSCRCCNR